MKAKDKNFKPSKAPVPRSAYFSSKKPRIPENQTFSGQSKAHGGR